MRWPRFALQENRSKAYSTSGVGTSRTRRLSEHASAHGVHDLSKLLPSLGLCCALTLALSGCARLPFFGKVEAPAPRPASALAPTLPPSVELPFVLSNSDDYVVRLVIGSVT